MKKLIVLTLSIFLSFFSQAQKLIEGDPPKDAIVYTCGPCGCPLDGKYFNGMGNCPTCNMPLQANIPSLQRQSTTISRPSVAILLFNRADIMDVSGPISVFEHAGLNIMTFAKTNDPVQIGMNLELKPDFTLQNLPKVDVLVFPGGGLAETNPGDTAIVQFIKERYDSTEVVFSVCSGAFFLGEAGILDGQKATTFASLIPLLTQNYPKTIALNNVKYTDNGKVVTSAGLSSGIDAAFHVVSKYYGVGRAQDIANHMEYPWKREHDYARSQLADNYLLSLRSLLSLFSTSFFHSQGDNNSWEMRFVLTKEMSPANIIALLAKELQRRPDWKQQSAYLLSINGNIEHPVLGKGEIALTVKEDPIKGPILIVLAERQSSYIP